MLLNMNVKCEPTKAKFASDRNDSNGDIEKNPREKSWESSNRDHIQWPNQQAIQSILKSKHFPFHCNTGNIFHFSAKKMI